MKMLAASPGYKIIFKSFSTVIYYVSLFNLSCINGYFFLAYFYFITPYDIYYGDNHIIKIDSDIVIDDLIFNYSENSAIILACFLVVLIRIILHNFK